MASMNPFTEFITQERNRTERRIAAQSAQVQTITAAQTQALSVGSDDGGYWNGAAYVQYFVLGKSLLGGSDVLR